MKKHSKQSKVSIKRFLCVSILIVGISIFSTMRANATTFSYDPPTYSSLIPHGPIEITSDLGFTAFPGSGTAEDPYLIEGYNITTTDNMGIYITGTTKYFTIRNCYIEAQMVCIYIDNVADRTATVINNTCSNNWHGIVLDSSDNSTVVNNTCNNNEYGINFQNSDSLTIANNTCNNNNEMGIGIEFSNSFTVANNTCNNNNGIGIAIMYSTSSNVTDNTCNNNDYGIYLLFSDSLTFANNTCNDNGYYGIRLEETDFCNITYNLLQENEGYGVRLVSGSDNNIIHHNNFVDNYLVGTSQARDDGTNNFWYDTATQEGNYWSDWSGIGSYSILGSASSIDLYPLDEPVDFNPTLIVDIIHSPSTPTELDTISINATVTDDSGIYNVTLHYRVNSGTWINASMTLVSGDLYSATIGPFAVSDTIEYYITAIDDSVNHNEATEDNGGLYYSLTIGSSDFTGPTIDEIVHSPTTPTNLDTISINATVTDDSGLQSVTLFYRVNGGIWQTISMTLLSGDVYSVTIGPFAVSDTIEYYVSAVDNSINHNLAIDTNSGLYYSFTVSKVIPEFQIFSLLLPAITLLFLTFILAVKQRRRK